MDVLLKFTVTDRGDAFLSDSRVEAVEFRSVLPGDPGGVLELNLDYLHATELAYQIIRNLRLATIASEPPKRVMFKALGVLTVRRVEDGSEFCHEATEETR